jgi:hypothetical protein
VFCAYRLAELETHINTIRAELRKAVLVASAITDGALDGEFRVDPMHTKGERDLAAMVQVVFEHMPDHPGA